MTKRWALVAVAGTLALAACSSDLPEESSPAGAPRSDSRKSEFFDQLLPVEAIAQLVDLVGPAYAKDILFSARTVSDREALAIGLVQRLVPAAELDRTTYDYLRLVADNAPLSVRGSKVTIQAYLAGFNEQSRARLRTLSLEPAASEDYREGTRALLEKRRPTFQGR